MADSSAQWEVNTRWEISLRGLHEVLDDIYPFGCHLNVLEDLDNCIPIQDKASPLFNCYCKSTGAALNMKKTEILAGYPPVPRPVTSKAWPVQTVTSYKYLGVLIGHLSSTERISPSITKAVKRAQEIIPRVIGLQRKILATNLYVNSILTYQCRFEIYPLKTVWNPYMGKIYRLITPSHCTSQEHLTTLTADGGFATPLLDMAWWNVATAVSALRHPNRTDPKKVLPTSPLQLIHTFNEKIPPTLRNPTDIYRAILDERPGKSLHHKLRTTMTEKPTAAHWINLVKNLNTKGIPPTLRNHALQIATGMKPLNNRMSHILHIASTCRHGCNSPESVKHILNTCRHNAAIRKELRLNSLKTLNVTPNTPNSTKSATRNLVGLYNYHVSTLPQNLPCSN